MKEIHSTCGFDVETILVWKDIDGDGVRRLHEEHECDACGPIASVEVQTVEGEPKYPRARRLDGAAP